MMLGKRLPLEHTGATLASEMRNAGKLEDLALDFDIDPVDDGYFEELLVSRSISKATTQEGSPLADDKVDLLMTPGSKISSSADS